MGNDIIMEDTKALANKIFVEMVEKLPASDPENNPFANVGVITSLNQFMDLVIAANSIYNETFEIPNTDQLVIAEDVPSEIVNKMNNLGSNTIDADTLRDLRIVTYTADERPAVIAARRTNEYNGTRSIKYRLIDIVPDPMYTGYSIARYGREIEADLSFHVWGINFEDIRKRGALLKDIIDTNVWFFKNKGLKDIIWQDSRETRLWDGKNLVKEKIERYLVRYVDLKVVREKNLEQVIFQFGLS